MISSAMPVSTKKIVSLHLLGGFIMCDMEYEVSVCVTELLRCY